MVRRVRRGGLSSELLMCDGGVCSILLLPLVARCPETIDVCLFFMDTGPLADLVKNVLSFAFTYYAHPVNMCKGSLLPPLMSDNKGQHDALFTDVALSYI